MPVSVVIPLRNEEGSVIELLSALEEQTYPPDEIICVDGGSTDRTRELIEGREWSPVPVRLIEAGPSLPGRGRNIGTREARNNWVAYIDGGMVPRKSWLRELVAEAEKERDAQIVFGNFEPRMDTFFTRCAATAYVKPPTIERGHRFRGPAIPSSLLKRSLWVELGGFPEHLRSGEDLLFIDRVMRSAPYAFAPEASVTWELAPTWVKTFRRFRTYSKSNIEAGMFRNWHLSVLSRYGVIAASGLVGYGALLPLGLLAVFLLTRGGLAVWRYRRELACSPLGLLGRCVGTVGVLVAVDLGLVLGTVDWFRSRLTTDSS